MTARRHSFSRGATLGTVLLLTVVITILALALVSSSVTHLHLSQRSTNVEVARNMAQSAVSAGLEEVLQEETFGALGREPEVLVLQGVQPGARGRLAFHKPTAASWGVGYSTNNLDQEGARAGASGQVVPGNSIHLVGQGESNGVKRSIEAIFHVPRFPYVVATSGRFQTEGETLIASIDRIESLNGVLLSDPDTLRPGDVVANSSAADALALSEDTVVTGDARAVGGVELEPGAKVLGEIRPNAAPETIPNYSVSDFDPEVTGKLGVQHLNQGMISNGRFEGWVRREGDLAISQGLHLDNGVLYVNGDLMVTGGVSGTGALLVNGSTTISGKSELATDNVAAIISDGDIDLRGSQGQNSTFRGLVYSNGGLRAENMTLVGTLLLGGDSGGSLMLKDTRVIYSPDSVKVDLQHSARTALTFVSPSGANPGAYLGTGRSDKSHQNKLRIYVSLDADGKFLIYPDGRGEGEARTAGTVEEALSVVRELVAGGSEDQMQAFEASSRPRLVNLLTDLQQGRADFEEEAVDLLTLDPSNFLSLSDRIRLIFMREV